MQIDDATPVWDMTGATLTLANLAIIADTLEKHGAVLVRNVTPDQQTPTTTALGFKIIHGTEEGDFLTEAVRLDIAGPQREDL